MAVARVGDMGMCVNGSRGMCVNGSMGIFCNDGSSGVLGDDLRMRCSLLVNNGVESVVRIGGIFNDSASSISLDERVATVDNISVTSFLLAFNIAGVFVMNIVRVAVLGMRVVIGVDRLHYCLSDGGCMSVERSLLMVSIVSLAVDSRKCGNDERDDGDELQEFELWKIYNN